MHRTFAATSRFTGQVAMGWGTAAVIVHTSPRFQHVSHMLYQQTLIRGLPCAYRWADIDDIDGSRPQFSLDLAVLTFVQLRLAYVDAANGGLLQPDVLPPLAQVMSCAAAGATSAAGSVEASVKPRPGEVLVRTEALTLGLHALSLVAPRHGGLEILTRAEHFKWKTWPLVIADVVSKFCFEAAQHAAQLACMHAAGADIEGRASNALQLALAALPAERGTFIAMLDSARRLRRTSPKRARRGVGSTASACGRSCCTGPGWRRTFRPAAKHKTRAAALDWLYTAAPCANNGGLAWPWALPQLLQEWQRPARRRGLGRSLRPRCSWRPAAAATAPAAAACQRRQQRLQCSRGQSGRPSWTAWSATWAARGMSAGGRCSRRAVLGQLQTPPCHGPVWPGRRCDASFVAAAAAAGAQVSPRLLRCAGEAAGAVLFYASGEQQCAFPAGSPGGGSCRRWRRRLPCARCCTSPAARHGGSWRSWGPSWV